MSVQAASATEVPRPRQGWGAVYALTLCVSALIASEFLPVSLLTPIAADLHVTEGQAGQAIAISGAFAVITSLLIARVTRGVDRRRVLLVLTSLMILSGLMVAFAPNARVFMAGRALIGVVVGGFWSMSAATVMRLVPEDEAPRALNLLNGGNALATTIAAPLGAFLSQYIGWRGAFFLVAPLGAVTLAWQYLTLPALPQTSRPRASGVFSVLRYPRVAIGMVAVAALFAGRFALFTYLRPFLETVTQVGPEMLSLFLLLIGGAGLVGSILIGPLLRTRLQITLVGPPLAMAALALGLILLGASPVVTAALLVLWGLISTPSSAAWWTWLSRTLPEDAEAGGGLMVAVIQLAITLGAALGGGLVDASGYAAAFAAGAVILLASAALTAAAARTKT
ncbi:MFS transporter [Phenylobacterium sp. LjRoot225]|uniref:MFS transporter n=1 Tax=Phenylobacterium sp. LjRoot225 TaxID=3342285 RepID=UPI003ECE7A1C